MKELGSQGASRPRQARRCVFVRVRARVRARVCASACASVRDSVYVYVRRRDMGGGSRPGASIEDSGLEKRQRRLKGPFLAACALRVATNT